jgi:hypothetical protein
MTSVEAFAYLVLPVVVVLLGLGAALLHMRSVSDAVSRSSVGGTNTGPGNLGRNRLEDEVLAAIAESIRQAAERASSTLRSEPVETTDSPDRVKPRVRQQT